MNLVYYWHIDNIRNLDIASGVQIGNSGILGPFGNLQNFIRMSDSTGGDCGPAFFVVCQIAFVSKRKGNYFSLFLND